MALSSHTSIVTTTLVLPLLPIVESPPQPPKRRWHLPRFLFLYLCVLQLVAAHHGRNKHSDKWRIMRADKAGFNWTEEMLSWQRTAYHFQPQRNWMNDPNGPLYHMGWYHLFYQYNPKSATWGNITWGHAVSRDLIHWMYLPLGMIPDHDYDSNGVWTGSATIIPDVGILILYTGDTLDSVQVQNLAYPADISDPLLVNWVKYSGNPVIVPPPGIGLKYFRDPTTAWIGADGGWRVAIGSKVEGIGMSLVYRTMEFTKFELLDRPLHAVPGTGMWECVDFYPVSTEREVGVDTSAYGPDLKHVLKVSLDDESRDYYVIGTYDVKKDVWRPDDATRDVGRGLRVDYGLYYASKSFYDPKSKRRILYGWSREADDETHDLDKGWASIHTIPRTVLFDKKTRDNLLQWPVKEVESLRLKKKKFLKVLVPAGSIVPLDVTPASQLDITAEFEMGEEGLWWSSSVKYDSYNESRKSEKCDGAWERKRMGPFGVLVLATATLSERTAVYFDITEKDKTHFCTDVTRSSMAPDVVKEVYGSSVEVLEGENPTARILVDHSVVESFAQGGRRCITARVYPTEAIYDAARIFLFNNATSTNVAATIEVWQMGSASIGPFTHTSSSL